MKETLSQLYKVDNFILIKALKCKSDRSCDTVSIGTFKFLRLEGRRGETLESH